MKILAKPGTEVGDRNPYTRLLYEHIGALGHGVDEFTFWRVFARRYDVLHFHWPEYFVAHASRLKAYLGTTLTLLAAIWARIRGMKIVWTVHNLASHAHRRPRLERWFWRAFCQFLDGYIALSTRGKREAESRHPRLTELPGFVVAHGHYRTAYSRDVSRSVSRALLNIPLEAKVTCFFGALARYKGLSDLIGAFQELKDGDLVLLIAGESEDAKETRDLLSCAKTDSRIRVHVGFVSPRQVQFYFLAADLIALPFRETWNSGSALLALSFDRPILVPDRSAFVELRDHAGRSWVRMYPDTLTAKELKGGIEWSREKREESCAALTAFEWPEIARKTVAAYQYLLEGRQDALSLGVSVSRGLPDNRAEQVHRG